MRSAGSLVSSAKKPEGVKEASSSLASVGGSKDMSEEDNLDSISLTDFSSTPNSFDIVLISSSVSQFNSFF